MADDRERPGKPKKDKAGDALALWMAMGVAIGTALGIALDNLALGIGTALGSSRRKSSGGGVGR